jgi:hypothetical protein
LKVEYLKNKKLLNLYRPYFYVLAIYLPPEFQRPAFVLLAKSLESVPFSLKNYFSSEIHRNYVTRLKIEGKQFKRQENYLNNKLVKIFARMGNKTAEK